MERGAWQATVHGVGTSWIRLINTAFWTTARHILYPLFVFPSWPLASPNTF